MSVRIAYFVHGTTLDNEQDLATGWQPGALSRKGVEQGRELGKVVEETFDAVFCSDLQRAFDTAQLAFGERYPVIQDLRLRECDYGDFTGHPVQEFKSDMTKFVDTPFPGGESYQDVEKRLRDFLAMLKKDYDGKRIAIVAHQGPQLALDVILKGKTWKQAIAEDWRHTKSWQPGWGYLLT